MIIELDIIPPKNTGQSGKRIAVINKHAMMYETKESKQTKDMYWSLLYDKKPKEPLSGALKVNYYFLYPYNSSVPKAIQKQGLIVPKLTKPDWDNTPKQIQDIMTKLQFWKDDSQIFCGCCVKYYAPKGKIIIGILDYGLNLELGDLQKVEDQINLIFE